MMLVVDASAVVELLLRTPAADRIAETLLDSRNTLHAPALLDVEAAHVLRRYVRTRELTPARGALALRLLARFPIRRYVHEPLLDRIWALRDNFTAYDAAYIALAEALDATLVTRDEALLGAPMRGGSVTLV